MGRGNPHANTGEIIQSASQQINHPHTQFKVSTRFNFLLLSLLIFNRQFFFSQKMVKPVFCSCVCAHRLKIRANKREKNTNRLLLFIFFFIICLLLWKNEWMKAFMDGWMVAWIYFIVDLKWFENEEKNKKSHWI